MGNNTGSLRVSLDIDSYFLRNNLKVDIWDSDLQHCAAIREGQSLDLAEGLYQVSAVMPDGGAHKKIVEIKDRQLSEVRLGSRSPINLQRRRRRVPLVIDEWRQKSSVKLLSSSGDWEEAETRGGVFSSELIPQGETVHRTSSNQVGKFPSELQPYASVLSAEGARVVSSSRDRFVFEPDEISLDKLAGVTVQVEDSIYRVSLPLNRETHSGNNDCTLKVIDQGSGKRLYARFGSRRAVSFALQNMLDKGYLLQACNVAMEATDLLRNKYSEPTGAVLGALLLNKSGRLKERKRWLENLARDFPWIPDGKVLYANILTQTKEPSMKPLELALEASRHTMLFTESFSILLHMLRNWPWPVPDNLREEYRSVLMRLALESTSIDWSASTLTRRLGTAEKEPEPLTLAVRWG